MAKLFARDGSLVKFLKTPYPEKIWVICHPFCTKKAYNITKTAEHIAENLKNDLRLDGDGSGGQIDACRHAIWMALLSRQIGKKKAISLGKAHEKSNFLQYKRKKLEDNQLPDSIGSEMDMRNNNIGIEIAEEYSEKTDNQLIELIINAVLHGRLWKIKKDKNGNFLDWNNQIIPEKNYLGKWHNDKCLVTSSFKQN